MEAAGAPGEVAEGVSLLPYRGVWPRIDPTAFIAEGCRIVGDVEIGAEANIWFNCVIRGDEHTVRIGPRSNIQDGTVIHVHSAKQGTYIGADVTSATWRCCTPARLRMAGSSAWARSCSTRR